MEITINYYGQAVSVSVEVYKYLTQADHKAENLAHEQRRHWDGREFDEYIISTEGRLPYCATPEELVCQRETLDEILAVLALCTPTQRERFLLFALDGFNCAEIAEMCGCSKVAVHYSIEAVRKKRIDPDKEGLVHFVGIVLLMGLMILVMFNDIRKLFI